MQSTKDNLLKEFKNLSLHKQKMVLDFIKALKSKRSKSNKKWSWRPPLVVAVNYITLILIEYANFHQCFCVWKKLLYNLDYEHISIYVTYPWIRILCIFLLLQQTFPKQSRIAKDYCLLRIYVDAVLLHSLNILKACPF